MTREEFNLRLDSIQDDSPQPESILDSFQLDAEAVRMFLYDYTNSGGTKQGFKDRLKEWLKEELSQSLEESPQLEQLFDKEKKPAKESAEEVVLFYEKQDAEAGHIPNTKEWKARTYSGQFAEGSLYTVRGRMIKKGTLTTTK